jgi:uncharacterized membrane protein
MANRLVILRRTMMGLCILGILIAGYLTYTGLTNSEIYCVGGSTSCDTVQQSRYSKIADIPVALIGVFGYVAILATLIFEETKRPLSDNGLLMTFAFTLIGVLYSAYLTYLELFVILAICQYCVASAINMLILFGLSSYRLTLKESPA